MALSVSTSLEEKVLATLRGLNLPLPCVGLMEVADAGTMKEQDLSAVQVRVYNFAQVTEASGKAHEKIALWLQQVMLADGCTELDTDEAHVDGLQRTGDDKDFDTTGGEWFAAWNMTLSGRLKQQEET